MTPTLSESSRAYALSAQPWWTEADRAELQLLVREFVDLAWEHKACRVCAIERRRGAAWCAVLREELFRAYEWRFARSLISRVEFFRASEYQRRRASE